ncbi:putative sugar-binding protein [Hydrogenoanaerobacterium saccharovorans]|uniref:Uncharacterized Sugar-binding Domain n=1 Tax=Hydrogenoanaerobacterium saccharovorans TaxID=474960 RepID=A0A1H8E313_9FIRM|nr:Ig-like domain-containing protein [Hydrogenoanaerobacterium saccharovorans]RPF42080.1 putative sugar-binding protein [Hydrogenoanaerobacterium saccharovorans]SEN13158.1 Uncharacterised Sugar-binding Domain [Hydrogenoanaerobacterium saccharovorans]
MKRMFRRTVQVYLAILLSVQISLPAYASNKPIQTTPTASITPTSLATLQNEPTANEEVYYLVNCGTPDASVVPDGYTMGQYQSNVDQQYGADAQTAKKWGYAAPDANSHMKATGSNAKSITDTCRYLSDAVTFDKQKSGLRYAFELPNQSYKVVVGFKNPWSGRTVNIQLEGETLQDSLMLKEAELVEREYIAAVTDGELNVMVHNPYRTSQYADPIVSYIIVKSLPAPNIQLLRDTLVQIDAETADKYYTDNSFTPFTAARQTAQQLVNENSTDNHAISEAYRALKNAYTALVTRINYTSFTGVNGATFYDTNNKPIQAHGGQIQKLTVDGETKYYWIGEDKTYDYRPVGGIHLYSSTDLYNWKDEGVVLRPMESMDEFETDPYFKALYGDYSQEKKEEIFIDLDKNRCVIERPKMIYSEKTNKYVIWFHADGRTPQYPDTDYAKANAGVAIADKPWGPFKLLGSYDLNYVASDDQGFDGNHLGAVRDMNLFVDDDKTAYIIYSSQGNRTTFISKLNDTYTDLAVDRDEAVYGEHFVTAFKGASREAPAMFKYNNKYYIINSGCSGWNPNRAEYAVADHPFGPWNVMGDPCEGSEADTTFRTQSTCVFPVDAEAGKYIYMGDRWNAGDLSESRYVWLPVEFYPTDRLVLKRYSDWTLDVLYGKGLANILDMPEVFDSLGDLKQSLPQNVNVKFNGNIHQNQPVRWDNIDENKVHIGNYTVYGRLTDFDKKLEYKATIADKRMVYFFDCGTQSSSFHQYLLNRAPKMKRTESDQAYSEQNGAGYVGSLGTNFGKHDGGNMYEIGWWAESNQPIEYKFYLDSGDYNVITGYQEWWDTTRNMRISVTNNDGNQLAQKDFTLEKWDKGLVQDLRFTLNEPDTISVKISKRGGADPVLSFIGIVKENMDFNKNIISVLNIEDKKVKLGTEVSNLDLPKTITAKLHDDTTAEVPVTWNTDGYDGNKAGEYTLNGTLKPQAGIVNSNNLTVKIKVTVEDGNIPTPNKDTLLALIQSAKEKAKDSKYTQASRDALTKEIEAAQAIADNDKATDQEIADAQKALQNAIDALVNEQEPEKPSKDTLLALIANAKEMAKDSKYTQASRDALNKAIETAQTVADNDKATQQEIADAQKALQDAIDALVQEHPEQPSKEGLLKLLQSAKEMAKDSKYTQKSRDALTKAIATAQAVIDNANATKQQIADAQKALQDALKALVKQGGESSSAPKPRKHVEPNMVTSSGISEKVASSSKGADISVRSDYKVATGFLNDLMKNKDKSVTLNGDWYSWTFDGKNLENTMPGVIWFDTRITTDSPNSDAIGKLTEKADTTNLHFNYEGKLPGETVIRVQLEKYAGKPVYIYYHNPEKGRLELIQANVKADQLGWMEFSTTNGADYVISPTAIKGAVTLAKPAPVADKPQ